MLDSSTWIDQVELCEEVEKYPFRSMNTTTYRKPFINNYSVWILI